MIRKVDKPRDKKRGLRFKCNECYAHRLLGLLAGHLTDSFARRRGRRRAGAAPTPVPLVVQGREEAG
jgi:hypothetical protein